MKKREDLIRRFAQVGQVTGQSSYYRWVCIDLIDIYGMAYTEKYLDGLII